MEMEMNGASGAGWSVRLCTCREASTEMQMWRRDEE